ncbi:MAG: nuclear transport factor 2 family protein [Pseudomonadota bacterium]
MTDDAKFEGFSQRWKDFPDYIIGITKEIWEERGIESLERTYGKDLIVRTPTGLQLGNQQVIASTMATVHEFPDRELFGEDVIWSEAEPGYYLSSHRVLTTGTHSQDGAFGPATGKRFTAYVIADCAARGDTIDDEWLVRDYGGIVRQLGGDPRAFAQDLIDAQGGPTSAAPAFTPAMDVAGPYLSKGNDNPWGERFASILSRLANKEFNIIPELYDRAAHGHYSGGVHALSWGPIDRHWVGLMSSFPDAEFKVHHVIGMDGDEFLPPRASVRWSLDGSHSGWGAFGKPTGVPVHVMGMSQCEFGPFGDRAPTIRHEWTLYDEVSIWKQILMGSA